MHVKFIDRWVSNWVGWRKKKMHPADMVARLNSLKLDERNQVREAIRAHDNNKKEKVNVT